MIDLKNTAEIKIMAEAGEIGAKALKAVLKAIKPGISTLELDKVAEEEILKAGAEPAFKRVEDYKFSICVSVNDEVVHGLPSDYRLSEGDIIGIDTGAYYNGFNSDVSESVIVGAGQDKEKEKFLQAGKRALATAIKQAKVGNFVGDISNAMQTGIEGEGFSVVRELIGHGVGRELHEEPPVPGEGRKGTGPRLQEGMVLAIEAIYNQGKRQVYIDSDGWTVRTQDGSVSGLFERTVAVTKNGPKILTEL